MTDERRYADEEVREIFGLAAGEGEPRPPTSGETQGLTLAELQGIGLEVGLGPARIAAAAATLDTRRDALPRGALWGSPISVGRVVELPRAPSDREWDLLVAELRQTFGARGKVTSTGALREWTNGNLHAYVEPTETGHRLRLGTLKGSAMAVHTMGLAGLFMALILLLVFTVTGRLGDEIVVPLMFGAMGAGALLSNRLSLPRWAAEREAQMRQVAERATALVSGPGPDTPEPDVS
jgi:hypothetical protein